MMKKTNFLMLLAFVVFIGCRQELDVINPEKQSEVYQLTKDNVKTKMLKKADYDNMEYLQADVTKVSNFLKTKQNEAESSSKSIQVINGYEVYTDAFEEVSYLDAKYHSFYIISDKDPNAYEEKLVLKSVNDKIIEKYIVRYKRKPDFSIDAGSYQTLKLSDPPAANSKIMYVDTFSMGCSTYVVTSYECGYTGHHTNGQYCNVLNINMPYNTVSITFDSSCTAGGSGSGESGSSGGGGGAVPGSYTPPVITIPTSAPIYTTHGPKGKTCNPLALNSSEIDQINNDQSLRLRIYQYIAASGSGYPLPCEDSFFADEYKAFIKAIIKYVTDTNTPANDLTFDYLNSAYQFFQDEYYDMTQPENFLHRVKVLEDALVQNPNLLLNIPCNKIDDWKPIADHSIPQSVKDKLKNINTKTHWYQDDLIIQNLDNAKGKSLNMDLFSVKISNLPNKPGTNQKFTPKEFFDYFRLNLNNFAETFTPVVDADLGVNDTALWNSANPLNALISIYIPVIVGHNNGTVICSGVTTNTWVFTTITSPWDSEHPVSGNRFFSYYMNPNDNAMYIYTRGLDRVNLQIFNKFSPDNNPAFNGADELWSGMQAKIKKFVKDNGGGENGATIMSPEIYRPDWAKVKDYFRGNKPLSALGCN